MRIEFLGTGTSQGVPVVACGCSVCTSADPRDARTRSSVWVRCGGVSLLIDAGPDLRQQALRSGIDRLDAVLLTHEHMDHMAGVDELRAFNYHQRQAMPLHGGPGTLDAVRRVFHYAFAKHRYPGVPELTLHELYPGPAVVAGVPLVVLQVMHMAMPVLGFRIGGFTYVTDAKTIPDAAFDAMRGTRVLVLNALRRSEHVSHLSLSEALDVVRAVGPEQAYFTHVSHLMGRHAEVQRELPAGVHLAHDGLVLDLPDP